MKTPTVGSLLAAALFFGCYSAPPAYPGAFNATATPAEVTLAPGGIASEIISVGGMTGYAGAASVSVSGLPAGVSAGPLTIDAQRSSGALALRSDGTGPAGTFPITALVTAGSFAASATFMLTVAGQDQTGAGPMVRSFSGAAVFVGEGTLLTAVFDGDSASVDGLGEIQSGVAVETPPLAGSTTFTLRVRRGAEETVATARAIASYRVRLRVLDDAPVAQTNHVAAALPHGRALVMGGNTSESPRIPDSTLSQIFDPATETFARGPELLLSAQAQVSTSSAPLASGGFLLVGTGLNAGIGQAQPIATQVFDPAARTFGRVGDAVTRGTFNRTIVSLLDGGALLTGGLAGIIAPVSTANRYDAASGQWRSTGAMVHGRVAHTATLLPGGRVLIAGGISCCQTTGDSPDFFSASAELYDPVSGQFTETGSMAAGRASHAAALLPDGRVLITGGNGNGSDPLSTEIYEPVTGQFSPGPDLPAVRDTHSAVALTDGRILIIGGETAGAAAASTEIFDPVANRWSHGPTLSAAFFGATITMLDNGRVLIFGGQDAGGFPQSAAAIFE